MTTQEDIYKMNRQICGIPEPTKPEKILAIVTKNGFDWWGNGKYDQVPKEDEVKVHNHKIFVIQVKDRTGEWFSYADLAINKSFLVALMIEYDKQSTSSFDDYEYTDLQVELIDDLTEKKGKNFWKICDNFIGGRK